MALISMNQHEETKPALVVDLDGTLIRTDMLHESFWSAFASNWAIPFIVVKTLRLGRAALKTRLAELSSVDVTSLPYNANIIEFVKNWRESGGRTVLVTASSQTFADQVSEHLDIFDETYGSDATHNLKGPSKAFFLEKYFGESGFAYMGDAKVDLPVWRKASVAITVDAANSVRTEVEKLGHEFQHIKCHDTSFKSYLKAIRPHQWLKNLLIFIPMMLAHEFSTENFVQSLLAFTAFTLTACSVYVLNDLLDLRSDRNHPRKRNRPFASGYLPIAHGTWLMLFLLLFGLLLAVSINIQFVLVMVVYYGATTAYSLHLKRRMIIDIFTLAGLYTLRIIAGSAATGIAPSVWLLAFAMFFFFSLAAVKRQAELVDSIALQKTKLTGRGYHVSDVPIIAGMAMASGYVSVLVMVLYLNSSQVRDLYSSPSLLWGICLILLYWLSRVFMIAHRHDMHDDPIVFAVKDRISQICLVGILIFAIGGIAL